jgi:hypothetical protein
MPTQKTFRGVGRTSGADIPNYEFRCYGLNTMKKLCTTSSRQLHACRCITRLSVPMTSKRNFMVIRIL